MSSNNVFRTNPLGTVQHIKEADLADHATTVDLVGDDETDAFFFRALEQKGIKLNQPQLEAVRHWQGPALVLAGAGSGKTRVLTARTGYLITVKKVNPQQIMLVTFSKKAADEMKTRIEQLPGLSPAAARKITNGTFHSIFWRLLKSRGYNQRVLSNEKQKQLAIKLILKEKNLHDAYEPETLLAILSSYKNNRQGVSDLPSKTSVEKEIKAVLTRYEQWKTENNYLDFDDMLLESYYLLLEDQQLLQAMQTRFQHILVDEWQDTNPVQYDLIKLIAKPANNLFVVGDDDQTIYSFNGADQSIILDFEKLYRDATVVTLDINYRSTASILGIANQVIASNQVRKPKTLKATKTSDHPPHYSRPSTTDEEAQMIIEKINQLIADGNRQYRDIAILHRTISSSRAIVDQLVMTRIPFVSFTKGETFYEQAIVKPVIDYLRLSLNPNDWKAIGGIAPSLFLNRDKAIQHVQMEEILDPKKQLLKHLLSFPRLKDFQKQQLRERLKLIAALKEKRPVEAVKTVRKFYDNYVEANERKNVTLHKDIVLETLAEIEAAAARFDTVEDFVLFVDNVITRNEEMENLRKNPQADAVSLMTIHRAKGLEYPVVFLIGASENILPHSSSLEADNRKDIILKENKGKKTIAALEEERRLAYVAITRAEQELYISSPAYYRGEQVEISRFILDPFQPEAKQKKNSSSTPGKKALVWQCTSDTCICWIRIASQKEKEQHSRECPMCQSAMKQAVKEI